MKNLLALSLLGTYLLTGSNPAKADWDYWGYKVETETIKTMDTLTQSATVHKWRQTGSVAEAVALAPFTSPARLVCARQISDDGRAVCAVAQGERI